jgi:hypothetical protein
MREVTDAKRAIYYKATSRTINLSNVKKLDLMLCVKEDQDAIASHILQAFSLIDVCDIRGQEGYVTIDISLPLSGNDPYAK